MANAEIDLKQLAQIDRELRSDAVHSDIEDHDPFVCDRDVLEEMLAKASTPFARGYLAGVFAFRLQLGLMTGRAF